MKSKIREDLILHTLLSAERDGEVGVAVGRHRDLERDLRDALVLGVPLVRALRRRDAPRALQIPRLRETQGLSPVAQEQRSVRLRPDALRAAVKTVAISIMMSLAFSDTAVNDFVRSKNLNARDFLRNVSRDR